MQNLLSDTHPDFAAPEQAFIAEFNVDANGYDLRCGPACHKRVLDNPQAHRSGWVPLEEISEEDLHLDALDLPHEETDNDFAFDASEISDDKAFATSYPTDAWGVELRRAPHDAMMEEASDFNDLMAFNAFPCTIGSHKAVEVIVKKHCAVKLFCRFDEAHGKRGRKKLWYSGLARENSGRREHTLRNHMTDA